MDRPIIFSAPMVRALLDGRKTQTRRVLKPQPYGDVIRYGWNRDGGASWTDQNFESQTLRFWVGDRLWVREAHAISANPDLPFWYREGHEESRAAGPRVDVKWRPSIHMPRWASRLTLIVEDVKVERLQGLTEDDAKAEGVTPICDHGVGRTNLHWIAFNQLWDSLHGPASWIANPWVTAITFRVVNQNIDALAADPLPVVEVGG